MKRFFISGIIGIIVFALAVGYGFHIYRPDVIPAISNDNVIAQAVITTPPPPAKKAISNVCDAAAQEAQLEKIDSITAATTGTYGVYVVELDTGCGFGVKPDEWFPAASTTKVPILAKLYQEIEAGNVARDDILTYLAADYEEGTGTIQFSDLGSRWTVATLAEKMIKESDNVAKNMLRRELGAGEVETFIFGYGFAYDFQANETTPRSMANMLKLIAENDVVSAPLSKEMLDLMTGTQFEGRLPLYLEGVRVAHKIGTWDDAVSDVGIVYQPERPFIICVYSKDTESLKEAEETIAQIAASVNEYEASRAESY